MAFWLQVDGDFAHRLHRIGVEQDALVAGHGRGLLHREDDPGFVVGPHHRDDGGILGEGLVVLKQVQAPLAVHRQFGDPVALLGQSRHQGVDGRVFHPGGDDVAFVGKGGQGRADGGVVAFGAATGEDDLVRGGAQQGRHLFPGLPYLPAHLAPEGVHAGGVAVEFVVVRQHGLQDFGSTWVVALLSR